LHLNREQAFAQLETSILPEIVKQMATEESLKENTMAVIIDILKLMYSSSRWEDRFGAINGSILLVRFFYNKEEENDPTLKYFVWNTIRGEQLNPLLVDHEFRVRNQLGLLLREMISHDIKKGAQHFAALQNLLLENIEQTFTREPTGGVDASSTLVGHKKQINAFEESNNKTMHDTEGWKSLETSMRILQNIIEAIGTRLYEFELERVL